MVRTKKADFLKLARTAAGIAEDKKAKDVVILNVKRLTAVAEYFLIVTSESAPQTRAVVNALIDHFRDVEGMHPLHVEGKSSENWSVIDYGGLVVHVMSPQARALYSLERVWADARPVPLTPPRRKSS